MTFPKVAGVQHRQGLGLESSDQSANQKEVDTVFEHRVHTEYTQVFMVNHPSENWPKFT
jgi:hypothetical protein